MKYSNIPSAQAVVSHCKARGIENIVISPGSRNAPLTLGFTNDSYFKCFSVVDERSAGFFALGIAQQLQSPVVVLCTSGSALLNYYPAVAEAFYSDIPLVVLSADRPKYKIDIGDGQTIRQDGVFDRHIGYTALLKQDAVHSTEEQMRWNFLPGNASHDNIQNLQIEIQNFNDDELNRAFEVMNDSKLPIHINVPFEEPLYGMIENASYQPQIRFRERGADKEFVDRGEMIDIWNESDKKLIITGVLHPGSLPQQVLDHWAKDPSISVLTETTSNLAFPEFINSIDSVIAPIELASNHEDIFQDLKPDLVVTLGGLIVSKKIKAFLRNWQPKDHWHINEKKAYNTFMALTRHVDHHPGEFFGKFLPQTKVRQSGYKEIWKLANEGQKKNRASYLKEKPFSDLLVFDQIIKALPQSHQLQLANSSTIRYTQLFDLDPSLRVFCNRGTSGIDGSTSTAVGAALYYNEPTVLITGDLSFLYDINGLWNDYIRPDFRIIVINNGGGGIFRILPGRKSDESFERFFETAHQGSFDKICENFDLEYYKADDSGSLKNSLEKFFNPAKGQSSWRSRPQDP